MKIEGDGQLLRIFIGESDRWQGQPLHDAIVLAAREHGLAGATVVRGLAGFGASSRIHTIKILRLSEDLPIIVEIVDRAERIAGFLPRLDKMVGEGLITLENVHILKYRQIEQTAETAPTVVADEEIELDTEYTPPTDPATLFGQSTDRARRIIDLAKQMAGGSHRVYIDSVDVLLALLREREGIAGHVLAELNIESETVEQLLRDEVSRDETSSEFVERLDATSLKETNWLGHHYPGTEHLLLALCTIRPSAATDILMRLGIQPREICEKVLTILGHHEDWQRWLADHPDM